MSKHKPATPLPWARLPYKDGGRERKHIDTDDSFELHAANAYPRLVEAVRNMCSEVGNPVYEALLRDLGEL